MVLKKNRSDFLRHPIYVLFIVVFLMSLLIVQCGGKAVNSRWREKSIQVDGSHEDWNNALTYMEKENVSIGIMNDSDYLYMCLMTDDPRIKQLIRRQGLILWFDAQGGKNKRAGVHFPLGFSHDEDFPFRFGSQAEKKIGEDQQEERHPIREFINTELEILGEEEMDTNRLLVDELTFMEVQLSMSDDWMVYELKVALDDSSGQFPEFSVLPGKTIGIGLETPVTDRSEIKEKIKNRDGGIRGGGGMSGGGMRGGGMRGGQGRGMRVGRSSRMQKKPEPVKIWFSVQTANPPLFKAL